MTLSFSKYQGTGNDFLLLNNLGGALPALGREEVAALCHRRFGIGADGLMILKATPDADFRMIYYNADGGESTMCGNGGRCIVAFARRLGLIGDRTEFTAIDGRHQARMLKDGRVSLHMQDVTGVEHHGGYSLLNTGSPHYIKWVNDAQATDVFTEGRKLRYDPAFAPGGINVNFVQRLESGLYVRTYERGVEAETLSCGTGVTAAAIAATGGNLGTFTTSIQTPGGQLIVQFRKQQAGTATDVVLTGPAVFVFEGEITR